MQRHRSSFTCLALILPLACSTHASSPDESTTPTDEPAAEEKYTAATTITGPGVSLGSGDISGPCSVHDVQLGVDISGALQLNADSASYGCYGTRTLEGDKVNPAVNAILADGRALDINLYIDDSELDKTDAPATVEVWAREVPLIFGAYSQSWTNKACSATYQIEDLDVESDTRKTYRVQGSATCPEPLVGDDLGDKPTEPTVSLDRFDFVGAVVLFRSLPAVTGLRLAT